jgi:hypothetical protein
LTRSARARDRRASLVCWGAIALAIAGVFGTWRSSGPVSLSGVEGPHNGWLVIIFGLVALTGVGPMSRGGWLGIVTVLGSACVMVYTAVANLVDDNAVLGGNSGWGIWLTIVASAVLAGTALLAAVQRVRRSTRAGSRTSP